MRQQFRRNPAEKHLEIYDDFSGGMNTATSNERLQNNEMPLVVNVDLSGKGSIRKRSGRVSVLENPTPSGRGQGGFFYYKKGEAEPELLLAIGGKLYRRKGNTLEHVPIVGLESFQDQLPVSAVQYNDYLFIATGTKLVEYDGEQAKVVEPHMPTPQEAIFIGTNALADDPDAWIEDKVSDELQALGIQPSKNVATVNKEVKFTAFVSKPEGMIVLYKWDWKKSDDVQWTEGQGWTEGIAGKTWTFTFDEEGKYDIWLSVKDNTAEAVVKRFRLSEYEVKQTEDKDKNPEYDVKGIQTCRRILLHWDRLVLTHDAENPQYMYISDLKNPRYFPTTNVRDFSSNRGEPITSMVRYKNMLVVFTNTTVQTVTGKSPQDYTFNLVHDGLGCIAEQSAQVIGDIVVFLSHDGIKYLTHSVYTLETLNVRSLDVNIRPSIYRDRNACSIVHDNQYWICFPDRQEIYRYYYELRSWVVDKSTKLNFAAFFANEGKVYNLTVDGKLYQHDDNTYTDAGEVYDMVAESKFYDLSLMMHRKKLRRLYVLARHFSSDTRFYIHVYADAANVLAPQKGEAVIEDGYVKWKSSNEPNMNFYSGAVMGSWILGKHPLGSPEMSVERADIRGKCRRVKVIFKHSDPYPCEIHGFAFEFKETKI